MLLRTISRKFGVDLTKLVIQRAMAKAMYSAVKLGFEGRNIVRIAVSSGKVIDIVFRVDGTWIMDLEMVLRDADGRLLQVISPGSNEDTWHAVFELMRDLLDEAIYLFGGGYGGDDGKEIEEDGY